MTIGSPGSGKSTFARKLGDKWGLPLFYLDMIKHKPDRTEILREEFDIRLREIVNFPEWERLFKKIVPGMLLWAFPFYVVDYVLYLYQCT